MENKKDSLFSPKNEEKETLAEKTKKKNISKIFKKAVCDVNIRKIPNGEILKVLKKDDKIEILSEEEEWSRTPSGYIMTKYLK